MTNAEARIFLERYNDLLDRLDSRDEEFERLKARVTNTTASYSDVPIASKDEQSKIERYLVRLDELVESIASEINELVDVRLELRYMLDQLEPRQQSLLEWRYINRWDWNKISTGFGLSRSQTMKVHNDALVNLCKVLDNCHLG